MEPKSTNCTWNESDTFISLLIKPLQKAHFSLWKKYFKSAFSASSESCVQVGQDSQCFIKVVSSTSLAHCSSALRPSNKSSSGNLDAKTHTRHTSAGSSAKRRLVRVCACTLHRARSVWAFLRLSRTQCELFPPSARITLQINVSRMTRWLSGRQTLARHVCLLQFNIFTWKLQPQLKQLARGFASARHADTLHLE